MMTITPATTYMEAPRRNNVTERNRTTTHPSSRRLRPDRGTFTSGFSPYRHTAEAPIHQSPHPQWHSPACTAVGVGETTQVVFLGKDQSEYGEHRPRQHWRGVSAAAEPCPVLRFPPTLCLPARP